MDHAGSNTDAAGSPFLLTHYLYITLQILKQQAMRTACQSCDHCRIPRCNECSSCRNKKRCKQRGKCLAPKWVGNSPDPQANSPTVAHPPSTSRSSPGNTGSVSSAPHQSACSQSSSLLPSPQVGSGSSHYQTNVGSGDPSSLESHSNSSSTPAPSNSLLPSDATLFPFLASRLGSRGHDVTSARQGRSKAKKRSLL